MHQGKPAASILRDIHRFGLSADPPLAARMDGGHSGVTACIQYPITLSDPAQRVHVHTVVPKSAAMSLPASFATHGPRGSSTCAACRKTARPNVRISPVTKAASRPSRRRTPWPSGCSSAGVTKPPAQPHIPLPEWPDRGSENRHAIIDPAPLFGAMPWPNDLIIKADPQQNVPTDGLPPTQWCNLAFSQMWASMQPTSAPPILSRTTLMPAATIGLSQPCIPMPFSASHRVTPYGWRWKIGRPPGEAGLSGVRAASNIGTLVAGKTRLPVKFCLPEVASIVA